MPNFNTHVRGEIVTKQRLCLITGKKLSEIDNLIKEGLPVLEVPDGRGHDFKFATAEVIDWLIWRAGGPNPDVKLDLTLERARLAKAQAAGQFLKNDVTTGRLIPAEVIESRMTSAIGRCRALLLGIPSASAGQIVLLVTKHAGSAERVVRELLTKMVDAALAELVFTRDDDDEEAEAA